MIPTSEDDPFQALRLAFRELWLAILEALEDDYRWLRRLANGR